MDEPSFVPLEEYREYPLAEMRQRAAAFYQEVKRRRTVRDFSSRPVSIDVVEKCLRAAATAPSGANQQPWHFVVVRDDALKARIREAAEAEEREFYERRAPQQWLRALEPLGTGPEKPFLEIAPIVIAIFAQSYSLDAEGNRRKHYYVQESVGIATGILITALHHAGLATLTHTPNPMGFLNEILERPSNERPYLLLVAGYPAEDARVPVISKKSLEEVATFM